MGRSFIERDDYRLRTAHSNEAYRAQSPEDIMPHPNCSSLDRRAFLKSAAAGLVLFPHTDLGALSSSPVSQKTTVALVRTGDRKDGVRRVMALLDSEGIAGKAVNLKPNFNTADPAPAGTHNDTLAQIVTELQERDAREVIVGESSRRDSGQRVGPFQTLRHPLDRRIPPSPPCGGIGVQRQHMLPEDTRLRGCLHHVLEARRGPDAQTHS
jgi:hypothetical protein